MTFFIPWRVRNFISERWPLGYHLVANHFRNQNSREHWDATLERTWNAPNREWPEKVEQIAQRLGRDVSVLDVGCGTGSMLRALRARGFTNIHGLEQSAYAVARLSAEGIPMSKGNILDMPFEAGRFDAVIASEVLEHVIRRRRFLSELKRIVKPGGAVLIFVPDDCLGPIDEPEHVIKYNAGTLRKFLSGYLSVEAVSSSYETHTGARSLLAVCQNPVPDFSTEAFPVHQLADFSR